MQNKTKLLDVKLIYRAHETQQHLPTLRGPSEEVSALNKVLYQAMKMYHNSATINSLLISKISVTNQRSKSLQKLIIDLLYYNNEQNPLDIYNFRPYLYIKFTEER